MDLFGWTERSRCRSSEACFASRSDARASTNVGADGLGSFRRARLPPKAHVADSRPPARPAPHLPLVLGLSPHSYRVSDLGSSAQGAYTAFKRGCSSHSRGRDQLGFAHEARLGGPGETRTRAHSRFEELEGADTVNAEDAIRQARAKLVRITFARRLEGRERRSKKSLENEESPLTDSNRRPPPYHGGFGASRAYTRDHPRHSFSCKSHCCRPSRCVARRRACRF
jgi:hypothetical protein